MNAHMKIPVQNERPTSLQNKKSIYFYEVSEMKEKTLQSICQGGFSILQIQKL